MHLHRFHARPLAALLVASAAAIVTTSVQPARAQPPSNFALGVERAFALRRVTINPDGGDSDTSTSIALLGTPYSGIVYSGPRVTFDYLARGGFTVGGGFAYQSLDGEGDGDSISGLLFAPRAGYWIQASPSFGVWLRGGLSYFSTDVGNDSNYTALTLEVPLVPLVAGNRVGILIVPYADIGVAGGTEDTDATATELGLHFGLDGFL